MPMMEAILNENQATRKLVDAQGEKIGSLQSTMQQLVGEVCKLQEPRIEPVYMSVEQASRRYGICKDLVREIYAMPEAPAKIRVGSRILIPIKEFDVFFGSHFADR